MIEKITASELAALLSEKSEVVLLDVRTPEEHQAYNIGGMLIPMVELPYRLNTIPVDKPIVVYCRSGHRSQIALEFLKQSGFNDVRNLEGGVMAWLCAYPA